MRCEQVRISLLIVDIRTRFPCLMSNINIYTGSSDISLQSDMSGDTFPFTSASLRSLRLEQEIQDWEDARRALAHRRSMARAPLPRAPRPPSRQQQPIQEVRAPPPQMRCRDAAVHNTFMYGDMKGVYTVLKDPDMVNALLETVTEEMVWAPEMGEGSKP